MEDPGDDCIMDLRVVTKARLSGKDRAWFIVGQTLNREYYLIRRKRDPWTEYYAYVVYIDTKRADHISLFRDGLSAPDLYRIYINHLLTLKGKIKEPFYWKEVPRLSDNTEVPHKIIAKAEKEGIIRSISVKNGRCMYEFQGGKL